MLLALHTEDVCSFVVVLVLRNNSDYCVFRLTTFLETWKCQGIWVRSGKRPKGMKGRGICVDREIRLWQLNKITYLYFIRTVIHLFIRDVQGEFWLINVRLFNKLPTILFGIVNFQQHAQGIFCHVLTSLTNCFTEYEQQTYGSDSSHVTVPHKLFYYYYY